jgi:hypothetical protein
MPVIEEDIKSQELVVIEKAEVAVAEIKQRKPFVTAEFKCISDYDLCVSTRRARLLCALALFICIGRRVVPFVKGN